MTPTDLRDWMRRCELHKSAAAKALGIDRKTLDRYLTSVSPIPKLVALACEAVETRHVSAQEALEAASSG